MTKDTIAIRKVTDEDLSIVADIVRETLLEHIEASGGDLSMVDEAFLRTTLDESRMLVAEVDGELAGYLQYQIRPPTLMVNGAAVRPEHQRRGLGTRLFHACVQDAARSECERVEISVQPTNESVHELYLRLGFIEGENPSGWNQELSMPIERVLGLFG